MYHIIHETNKDVFRNCVNARAKEGYRIIAGTFKVVINDYKNLSFTVLMKRQATKVLTR